MQFIVDGIIQPTSHLALIWCDRNFILAGPVKTKIKKASAIKKRGPLQLAIAAKAKV